MEDVQSFSKVLYVHCHACYRLHHHYLMRKWFLPPGKRDLGEWKPGGPLGPMGCLRGMPRGENLGSKGGLGPLTQGGGGPGPRK